MEFTGNFMDAVGVIVDSFRPTDAYEQQALKVAQDAVDAYDALAPAAGDWEDAPEWANWYTIDANGDAWFDENEPVLGLREWNAYGDNYAVMPTVVIPLGIPWTSCKWRRPEKTETSAP